MKGRTSVGQFGHYDSAPCSSREEEPSFKHGEDGESSGILKDGSWNNLDGLRLETRGVTIDERTCPIEAIVSMIHEGLDCARKD